MVKHKTEDYKLSAVNYYIKNKVSMDKVCEIFDCKKQSLSRWVVRYEKEKSIKRYSRKEISYKITKEQVNHALILLKQNQQITMTELIKLVKKKYKDFDITPQHLGKVLKDNNKTRKRTRHEHFPITRYKKPINKKEELIKFYKEVGKYKLNKIISLDETSISPAMIAEYSRCESGKRCVVKTNDSFFFRKFTLLVAIKNTKCIGWFLYEKGGMTKDRLIEFMDKFIFRKYKKHLIILDNAGSHRNNFVKDAITNSGIIIFLAFLIHRKQTP
jgi:transposase-like protein